MTLEVLFLKFFLQAQSYMTVFKKGLYERPPVKKYYSAYSFHGSLERVPNYMTWKEIVSRIIVISFYYGTRNVFKNIAHKINEI